MTWCTPAADPSVVDLALATPPEMKLNRRVYLQAVRRICGESLSRIPDANTGLPISASPAALVLHRYRIALRRRVERSKKSMASSESWPNWRHYVRTSMRIRDLWIRQNAPAREIIHEITGEPFREDTAAYLDRSTKYFMRLLTLKLWLDQRQRN
jgi:hypothetical protein